MRALFFFTSHAAPPPRRSRPHRLRAAALVALSAFGALAAMPADAQRPAARLPSCSIPPIPGPVECGTIRVPEDRSKPRGRQLDLYAMILRATGPARRPDPLVVLAGGPGQGAAGMAAPLTRELEALREHRDILLVDQRGTGRSNPLACEGNLALLGRGAEAIARCAGLLSKRADLRRYTTLDAVADLEHVRATLGYARLNLVGVSYGSRVAQAYATRYPDRVRTVVLRAVAPPAFNIPRDGERNAARALSRLLDDCAGAEECARAYPALRAELDSVLARSARAGDSLDRALLGQTFYALMLAAPTRQQLPFLVHRAAVGGVQTLAPVVSQVRDAIYGSLPIGMYLSVVCSEDVPFLTSEERRELSDSTTLVSRRILEACDAWPKNGSRSRPLDGELPRGPALVISGALDPATDVAGAEGLARDWRGARHLLLPATAHGPMFPGCAPRLVATFLDSAGAAPIDDACLAELKLAPFFVPPPAR